MCMRWDSAVISGVEWSGSTRSLLPSLFPPARSEREFSVGPVEQGRFLTKAAEAVITFN